MAAPVISAVNTQTITVDVDYVLNVGITGIDTSVAGHSVEVEGLFTRFYYSWNQTDNRVEIRGKPHRLYSGETFTITAINPDGTTTLTAAWSVVYAAPVIDEIGERSVFKGADNFIFLEVRNRPTLLRADGLWLGMDAEPAVLQEKEGIALTGLVPIDAEFTVSQRDTEIYAENDGGIDTYDLPLKIREGSDAFLLALDGTLRKVSVSGSLAWTVETTPPATVTVVETQAHSDGSVYVYYGTTNGALKRVSASGSLSWTRTLSDPIVWHLNADGTSFVNLQEVQSVDVRKVSASGSEVWRYTASNVSTAVSGNSLPDADGNYYVVGGASISKHAVRKISTSGSELWKYETTDNFSNKIYLGSDGSIHLWISGSRKVRKLSSAGAELWDYTAPSGTYDAVHKDSLGNFYLLSTSTTPMRSLLKLSPTGELLWTIQITLNRLRSHTVWEDTHGNIYFQAIQSTGLDVSKVSPGGTVLWEGGKSSLATVSMLIDVVGNLYALDHGSGELEKFGPDNVSLWTYTVSGITNPIMVLGSDQSIYIYSESLTKVVKVFPIGALGWEYTSPENVRDLAIGL